MPCQHQAPELVSWEHSDKVPRAGGARDNRNRSPPVQSRRPEARSPGPRGARPPSSPSPEPPVLACSRVTPAFALRSRGRSLSVCVPLPLLTRSPAMSGDPVPAPLQGDLVLSGRICSELVSRDAPRCGTAGQGPTGLSRGDTARPTAVSLCPANRMCLCVCR